MANFIFYTSPTLTLVCVPSGAPVLFSLDAASRLTGVHSEMLRYYRRLGLLDSHRSALDGQLSFDEKALCEVRRIEHYRRYLGVSRRALPLICQLWREGERLQINLRFLNGPSGYVMKARTTRGEAKTSNSPKWAAGKPSMIK
jgi:DNA-binding transcriptional MerR regulator